MTESIGALLVGFGFGWILQRAGLSRYERIVGVYRLTDSSVAKFLLSAVVTGALCLRAIPAVGLASSVPVPSTQLVGNAIGGLLFGVGMALSGYCPGTVATGAGEGRLDYLFPGVLGLSAGALSFGFAYPRLAPMLSVGVHPGETMPGVLGVDPWLCVMVLAELALLAFAALEGGTRRDGRG